MKRRFVPAATGFDRQLPEHVRDLNPHMEFLLRTCQLLLLLWVAVLGAQLAAKGAVQGITMLIDLLR